MPVYTRDREKKLCHAWEKENQKFAREQEQVYLSYLFYMTVFSFVIIISANQNLGEGTITLPKQNTH